VTNLNIGFVDHNVIAGFTLAGTAAVSSQEGTINCTHPVIVLELDHGGSRTKVAAGGADELQPGLNARFPIVVRTGNVARVVNVHGAKEQGAAGGSDDVGFVEVAPVKLVLHFARNLQAVGVGRNGQARQAELVADVQRGEHAQIGS